MSDKDQDTHQVTLVQGGGAVMTVEHKGRTVPGYVVTGDELDNISKSSHLVEFGIGVAAGFGSIAISWWLDTELTANMAADAKRTATVLYWICGIVAFLGAFLAAWQFWGRRQTIRRITNEPTLWSRIKGSI